MAPGAAGLSAIRTPAAGEASLDAVDDRRFGGLRRLYGDDDYARLRALRVAVVGLGGVGSWTVEALARSGVAGLVLIDFDHVAESNINRQVQALGTTLGQAKGEALRARIADIHPGCVVQVVDEFATPQNWPGLLPGAVDAVVDACDQASAKAAMAAWALAGGVPFVLTGAAGGKREPQRVEVGDLAEATHDPLLASVRQRLRKHHGAARNGPIGLRCVYAREPVMRPPAACAASGDPAPLPGAPLACAGYGSSVMVTATFGMVAAAQAVEVALQRWRKAAAR